MNLFEAMKVAGKTSYLIRFKHKIIEDNMYFIRDKFTRNKYAICSSYVRSYRHLGRAFISDFYSTEEAELGIIEWKKLYKEMEVNDPLKYEIEMNNIEKEFRYRHNDLRLTSDCNLSVSCAYHNHILNLLYESIWMYKINYFTYILAYRDDYIADDWELYNVD